MKILCVNSIGPPGTCICRRAGAIPVSEWVSPTTFRIRLSVNSSMPVTG
nr:MAG TPA: MTAbl13 of grafted MCoTI-II, trypsin inhibitor, Hydrolase Inhibitor [Caudoviricetes sp.]